MATELAEQRRRGGNVPVPFLVGFSLLLTHEMDAIKCKEWEVFPGLETLSADAGYLAFTALHIPLYALLLQGLLGAGSMRRRLISGLDMFFVVHIVLHLLRFNHPRYRFTSPFSWALILGAGLGGAIDLLRSH